MPGDDPGAPGPVVVGIGASAGGLDDLGKFFGAVPADCDLAFVVIPHLGPARESLMADLLAGRTSLRVTEAEDRTAVAPGRVYVLPPNGELTIRGGVLYLSGRIEGRGIRMPIDSFLESLAEDRQGQAVAVILSGAGTDGARGLKAVKANGGMVMAQDPGTARHDGMPRSAIATDQVDYVLPAERMPEALLGYVRHPYLQESLGARTLAETAPDQVHAILSHVRDRNRHDFSAYKRATLARRIQRRMGLKQVFRSDEYLRLLRDDPVEVDTLFRDLLIGVTSFFRAPEAWVVLEREVVRPLVEERGSKAPIRVWVPGCSTGEEAYSLAMLLIEECEAAGKDGRIQVFATDVNRGAIDFARAGVYPEGIAADVPPERLRRFFVQEGHVYRVAKQPREAVVFAVQNLIGDAPFSNLDLISCRNLLIYLEPDAQEKVIALFHSALRKGGYLFLGNAETVGRRDDLFEPVSKKWRVYRRTGSARHEKVEFPVIAPLSPTEPGQPARGLHERKTRITDLAQRLVLERYAPACVLVNRRHDILYFCGPTHDYLVQPPGLPTTDLLAWAREGLRSRLRVALHRAEREDQAISGTDVRVRRGGRSYPIEVTVTPITAPKEAEGLLLVSFAERPATVPGRPGGREPDGADEPIVRQLEQELKAARDDLRGNVELLEESNEELKAANEELTSVNEDLQSTGEELKASEEELHSLNEELATVNNQLQDKVEELESTNETLNNLLSSTNIPTIFLDKDFCIKLFTPAVARLFGLSRSDLGRPVAAVVEKFARADLPADAQAVSETLAPMKREVHTRDGRWYIRRVLPYRTADGRAEGVVVTFSEVTELKQAELAVQEARDDAESIVETVKTPLIMMGEDLRVRSANHAFYATFRATREETEGRPVYDLCGGQWDLPELRAILESVADEPRPHDVEIDREFEGIGHKTLMLNANVITRGEKGAGTILLAIEDITVRREQAEKKLRESEERLRVIYESSPIGIANTDAGTGNVIHTNPAFEAMLGYKGEELRTKNLLQILHPADAQHYAQDLKALGEEGNRRFLELRFFRKDGSLMWGRLAATSVCNPDGSCVHNFYMLEDITDRKELERQIADLPIGEQRKIGQELHDSTGQELTGLAYMARSMVNGFAERSLPEHGLATRVAEGIERALNQLRMVAKGLIPVEVDAIGLMAALEELAARTHELYGVECVFDCGRPVLVHDNTTATHLYRIAQEAVTNALKHGRTRHLRIILETQGDVISLKVRDDGVGIADLSDETRGMGLKIMRYRAGLIGATLKVEPAEGGGTLVACSLCEGDHHG